MLALGQVLTTPLFLLGFIGLLVAGALVHEFGHAVGCRAGGAQPGAIGVGVYLLFPAFYTDVTQSYRLGRSGRLRTDLGGLYFNVWCLLAAGTGYLLTGQPVLLMVLVFMHLEMVQQLVPAVRFDGYFVLADLAGVPDLFARVRPVLGTLRPGRPLDPRVAELRPAARRVITAWVAIVVPALAAGLAWFVWNLPTMVRSSVTAMTEQAQYAAAGWASGDLPSAALAVLAILLLSVPLVGVAAVLPRLLTGPFRWWSARRERTTRRASAPEDRTQRRLSTPTTLSPVLSTGPGGPHGSSRPAGRGGNAVSTDLEDFDEYHHIVSQLDRYYDLILLDTVVTILDGNAVGPVGVPHQADRVEGGRVAGRTLDWLDEHGYHELVAAAVVVNLANRPAGLPRGRADARVA
jgi:putative peptide zinc metalloprotease protein